MIVICFFKKLVEKKILNKNFNYTSTDEEYISVRYVLLDLLIFINFYQVA